MSSRIGLSYRAEIDGLRAISVASVILYHAQVSISGQELFAGGYIGVDIFFVISGYLITRLILAELRSQGSFSFLNFYERRARRLLPALLLVSLVSLPFAWQYLLPRDLIEYTKSVLASTFFCSNFYFYLSATKYGAEDALLMPFLHTWSLGIEEQFYIVFPVILLTVHRFFRARLTVVLLFLFALSLYSSLAMELQNPNLNFFSPLSRFWEFSAGAIIATLELSGRIKRSYLASTLLPSLGFIFIVCSVIFFDSMTPHPGPLTLMPVVGAALIIAYSSGEDPIAKILSSRILVSLGLISYSAYLWHYPIFAFGRYTASSIPGGDDKFAWILLTLGLSAVSYLCVEKPFRNKPIIPSRNFFWIIFCAGALLVAALLCFVNGYGYPQRFPALLRSAHQEEGSHPWARLQQNGKQCHNRKDNFCSMVVNDSPVTLYAFGDSHFSSLSDALLEKLNAKVNYIEANMDRCPFVEGIILLNVNDIAKEINCDDAFQRRRMNLLHEKPAIVLVGGRYPLYLHHNYFDNKEGGKEKSTAYWGRFVASEGDAGFEEKFIDAYRNILSKGHHLILVYPIPSVGWDVPRLILSRTRGERNMVKIREVLGADPVTTSASVYYERAQSTFELFDSLDHANVHRVYPHTLFCDSAIKGRCVTHDTEDVFYTDTNHPSEKGAEMIAGLIAEEVIKAKGIIESQ